MSTLHKKSVRGMKLQMDEISYQVGEWGYLSKIRWGEVICEIFPINGLRSKGSDIYNKFKRKTSEIEWLIHLYF